MQGTFKHEISFLRQTIDPRNRETLTTIPAKVKAHFKELNRLDKSQHKLHTMITQTFRKFTFTKVERKENDPLPQPLDGEPITEEQLRYKIKMELDDEAIYDLTCAFIKTMSILEDRGDFDQQTQSEILADSGALYKFGMWVLGEKIAPFFLSLHET